MSMNVQQVGSPLAAQALNALADFYPEFSACLADAQRVLPRLGEDQTVSLSDLARLAELTVAAHRVNGLVSVCKEFATCEQIDAAQAGVRFVAS